LTVTTKNILAKSFLLLYKNEPLSLGLIVYICLLSVAPFLVFYKTVFHIYRLLFSWWGSYV